MSRWDSASGDHFGSAGREVARAVQVAAEEIAPHPNWAMCESAFSAAWSAMFAGGMEAVLPSARAACERWVLRGA